MCYFWPFECTYSSNIVKPAFSWLIQCFLFFIYFFCCPMMTHTRNGKWIMPPYTLEEQLEFINLAVTWWQQINWTFLKHQKGKFKLPLHLLRKVRVLRTYHIRLRKKNSNYKRTVCVTVVLLSLKDCAPITVLGQCKQ